MQKSVIFVNKNLKINMWKIRNIVNLEITAIIQGNKDVLRIAYVIHNIVYLKKINIHNVSNYNYHFIIKKLVEEFEKQFTCLGENTEKYI